MLRSGTSCSGVQPLLQYTMEKSTPSGIALFRSHPLMIQIHRGCVLLSVRSIFPVWFRTRSFRHLSSLYAVFFRMVSSASLQTALNAFPRYSKSETCSHPVTSQYERTAHRCDPTHLIEDLRAASAPPRAIVPVVGGVRLPLLE